MFISVCSALVRASGVTCGLPSVPGQLPGLLIAPGQHEVENSARESRSDYLIKAVVRFDSAIGKVPNAFSKTEVTAEAMYRKRRGCARNLDTRQAAVAHHEVQLARLSELAVLESCFRIH